MSVLTVLCFSSLVFFSLADPVPPTPAASPDSEEIQAQISALVADIQKAIEERLAPLLKSLEKEDQDYLTATAADGIFGFINFVEARIRQREKEIEEFSKDIYDDEVEVEQ